MSSHDSSHGRQPGGRRSGTDDAGDTPIAFYVFVGTIALAVLFFLIAAILLM